jgi:hypothetical protein
VHAPSDEEPRPNKPQLGQPIHDLRPDAGLNQRGPAAPMGTTQ